MSINRRTFLRQSMLSASAMAASALLPYDLEAAVGIQHLTILHTNDVHSHLEPFPMDGSTYQGLGGIAARAQLINEIRHKNKQVLLLDAGDIFQGTPYFNLYKGEPEIQAMSRMQYDATTMGNHDFDAGLDNFSYMIQKYANFPVVNCNYDFAHTSMEGKSVPYKVFQKGDLKVGILGVGIELKGLVSEPLYGNVKYLDPIQKANDTADYLKKREGCDIIICLSHLGDKYNDNKVSDEVLAKESHYIDIIIGGHTHRFFEKPRKYVNKNSKEVIVNQVGWAGIQLGRLDLTITKNEKRLAKIKTILIGKKYED